MSRIFALVALVMLMGLLLSLPAEFLTKAPLSMLLGFLLLAGFVFGKICNYLSLPGITGYLLAGVAVGPSCFSVLDKGAVDSLELINSFALTLIALTAGGEVSLKRVWKSLSSFCYITLCQVVITFAGVMAAMAMALSFFPESFASGFSARLVVAALLAVVALANSPSSTVAVIVETGAKGRVTEMVLGITIIKDILVILFFALVMATGSTVLGGVNEAAGSPLAGELSWEIGGSIVFGVLLGLGIIGYMVIVNVEIPIFIIALSFFISKVSSLLHLHPLLVCMSAGLVVNNLSGKGRDFIHAIERGSLPIYVVFFAIAGAGLDLGVLAHSWLLVLFLVGARSLFTWLGTWTGSRLAGEGPRVSNNLWMGFFPQAGVTLGMAVIVAETFTDWGTAYKNVVVGAIAIFQLIGPVLFKYSLQRAGEIPVDKRRRN